MGAEALVELLSRAKVKWFCLQSSMIFYSTKKFLTKKHINFSKININFYSKNILIWNIELPLGSGLNAGFWF